MKKLAIATWTLAALLSARAELAWDGNSLAAWQRGAHQMKDVRLESGKLTARPTGWDAFFDGAVKSFSASPAHELVFIAQSPVGGKGEVFWVAEKMKGPDQKHSVGFEWKGDGQWHEYRVRPHWCGDGDIQRIRIDFPRAAEGAGVCGLSSVRIVDRDELPAELHVRSVRAAEAFLRAGQEIPVEIVAENVGGETALNVTAAFGALPEGVVGKGCPSCALDGDELHTFSLAICATNPGTYEIPVKLTAEGLPPQFLRVPMKVEPSLGLPSTAYVPDPKPAKTDYDIGALYFPGWCDYGRWERVRKVCPERKPVLGWYDEANPEVVDWQIKWLVEHGIRTLYVDWYWNKGSQHLDHWVKAFYRAKYRRYLKWAMMWANHNPPGSHSEEDQRAVTRFWIENYFNTPEYLQIDGKPVVWIWAPQNMDRDVGAAGCRKLLEISREMARAAGYKDIWFIAMKWPEADCSPAVVQRCKDWSFDMTCIYHFMSHGGREKTDRRFSFRSVAEANPENWEALRKTGILPFLPNLSTGWDDRPWNDHCEIYGKNVADFRRICAAAKAFADETGIKRLCLAPLNEWGEGSYAEPNAEHGFGFYEAVRDTFCVKPADGWPHNYGPKDVGLGSYDLPAPSPRVRMTRWDCTSGEPQGWRRSMGLSEPRVTDGGVAYVTTTRDPALTIVFPRLRARDFREVVVRMRTKDSCGMLQLFWASHPSLVCEGTSLQQKIVSDGAWHEYRFPVSRHAAWRGRIGTFRLDPGNIANAEVEISSVNLEK